MKIIKPTYTPPKVEKKKFEGQVQGEYTIHYIFYPYENKKGGCINLSMGNLGVQDEINEQPLFNYDYLYDLFNKISYKLEENAYKQQYGTRAENLQDLTALSQELGLYDDEPLQQTLLNDDELIGNSERELLKEDGKHITFTITLTKKQYETFNKRGGVKWLKKKIACRPYRSKK